MKCYLEMGEKESFDEYRLLILDNFKKLFKELERVEDRLAAIEKQMVEQKVKVSLIGIVFGILGSAITALIIKVIGK